MKNNLNTLFSVDKKTILVTGACGQLGSELCSSLSELGAKVIGVDLKLPLSPIDGVKYFSADISKEDQVKLILEKSFDEFGQVDALINNAGVAVFTPFLERKEEELDFVIDVNLKGTFYFIKHYTRLFDKKNLNSGAIVNIASIFGAVSPDFRNYTDCARNSSEIYGATKAGVIQMTKYFATNLAARNIRVNSISPGGLLNEVSPQGEDFQKNYSFRCPMGRMGLAKEITGAALYFITNASTYTTGQNLLVDGGLSSW